MTIYLIEELKIVKISNKNNTLKILLKNKNFIKIKFNTLTSGMIANFIELEEKHFNKITLDGIPIICKRMNKTEICNNKNNKLSYYLSICIQEGIEEGRGWMINGCFSIEMSIPLQKYFYN